MFGMEGHHAVMRNCDMTNALMKDSEFPDADFKYSLLVHTRLIRAVMTGSDFSYTNCTDADFSGGGFAQVNFSHAVLKGANFQGCRLQYTNFEGADIEGCNFFGAHMEKTNFAGAINIPKSIRDMMEDGKVTGNVSERDQ
jgi:uncharacterized protein YjbI with pentapeptide repeats